MKAEIVRVEHQAGFKYTKITVEVFVNNADFCVFKVLEQKHSVKKKERILREAKKKVVDDFLEPKNDDCHKKLNEEEKK